MTFSDCLSNRFLFIFLVEYLTQLSMPWWNLISEGLLYPLTVQEWSTLAESYPRGKIADFVIHEDISDDDETEEDDVKDEEVENINDSSVIDSQSGSASKSHSVSVHSPMYLHPDFSDKSDWQLFPRQFSQFCTECYGRILADRNSYQNARFRVRLIRNADEILLETVQTSLSESHTIGNGSSSTSTEPPISPDQANKVGGGGGDGGNWHPKVLRVDAKLVFGPHVRLSRIVLGCLLVGIHCPSVCMRARMSVRPSDFVSFSQRNTSCGRQICSGESLACG